MRDDNMETAKKFVLVKTISTFEHSFVIPMQEGMTVNDHLDYVTCQEIEEFSQEHVDECILPNCTRVITEDEAIELFDKENNYLASWSRDYKLEWMAKQFRPDKEESDDNG